MGEILDLYLEDGIPGLGSKWLIGPWRLLLSPKDRVVGPLSKPHFPGLINGGDPWIFQVHNDGSPENELSFPLKIKGWFKCIFY